MRLIQPLGQPKSTLAGPAHARDEILVYVLPVLPGDGIRFYSSAGLASIELEPLDSTRSGAVTILRFRVRKQSSV